MKIRNDANFDNYMKDFGSTPQDKELKQKNCVAIFLVALGFSKEKANKWAYKGILTIAPLQNFLAKKGQELVKQYNIKQVELLDRTLGVGNIDKLASSFLNTNQIQGKQLFVTDEGDLKFLTLKMNEEKLEKLFKHHNGDTSQRLKDIMSEIHKNPLKLKFEHLPPERQKDIEFLLLLVYSPDPEALLSKADEAAAFNKETELDIDVYLPTEDWGAKVKEALLNKGLDVWFAGLITPDLFDKSKSDLEIFENILKINERLKGEISPEIHQMLQKRDMTYQIFSDFMLREEMNPASSQLREFRDLCNKAGLDPDLTSAALNQLENQWFFTNLSSDAIKGIVDSLKKISDRKIDASAIVVDLKNHIDSCMIKGVDPFSKEQLKNLESRVINRLDRDLTGEEIRKRKDDFAEICKSKGIGGNVTMAVIQLFDAQGFFQQLTPEAMQGVSDALKKLTDLKIGAAEVVAGLKEYLDNCYVEGIEPFSKEQLNGLEARIINPTELIRAGTEITQYRQGWVDGLPKRSPLVKPFLDEFGFAVPFPHKFMGWEPGDAQEKIFKQMEDFATKNPNISPQAIAKAFKREVIAIADRVEPKATSAYYLKEDVVRELANSDKVLQRLALYAEVEKLLAEKKVPESQIPLLAEFLMAKIDLNDKPLSKNGHAVLEHLVALLADPSMKAEEKGHILSSIQMKELFDLSKIDNVENRKKALTAEFKKPSKVELGKIKTMMHEKPGSLARPIFKVLMGFFRDKLDTREGVDAEQEKCLNEVEQGLNKSSYLKAKLEDIFRSFLPSAGADIIYMESPQFVKVDLATFSAELKVNIDKFEPPPSPLTINDPGEQAVHNVMQGVLNNVVRARSELSGLNLFLTETWPELRNSFVWKVVSKLLTQKGVHRLGRVIAKLSRPIEFFANKFFDKAIEREMALGNEAKAQMYKEVKEMFKPLLMLFTSLVPGIMQRHSLLCVGENSINIQGALDLLSAAVQDPDFNEEKQKKLLVDLKPYLGQLLTEIPPYGDLINNIIAGAAYQGT